MSKYSNSRVDEVINFMNLWIFQKMVYQNFQSQCTFILAQGKRDDSFIKVKNQRVESKLNILKFNQASKEQQQFENKISQYKLNKKLNKKQTTIKKKHPKLEKVSTSSKNKCFNKSAQNLSEKGGEIVSLKALLNNGLDASQRSFEKISRGLKDKNSYSSSPVNLDKTWHTPQKIKGYETNYSGYSGKSFSPINEFSQSEQIQVVKHNKKLWPLLQKNKTDIIEIAENIREAKKQKTQGKKSHTKSNKFQRVSRPQKQPSKQQKDSQKMEVNLAELYLKSIGNKYMQKIIQNCIQPLVK